MITPVQIKAAAKALLEEAFPGEPVYLDLTPRDFRRPCNLLEVVKTELDPQGLGRGTVGLRWQLKITTFCQVDEVHDSHLPTLDLRAMLLLGAFAQGYVKVENRAPKVTACTADTSLYDCAEVTLILALAVDRADFAPEELLPLMEQLTLKIKPNKEAGET